MPLDPIPLPAQDVIHVWRVVISTMPVDTLSGVLDMEECARAARFLFEKDRNQFVVARGMLRHLLGAYLRREPSAVRFAYGAQGKPELKHTNTSNLRFNVSHSNDIVLLAFTTAHDVGVDVECIREPIDIFDLARTNFSPAEQHALHQHDPAAQVRYFFQLWTAKEAYIKMAGGGLSIPLQNFTIEVQSECGLFPMSRMASPLPPARVHCLPIGSGYTAAVAASDTPWCLDIRDADPMWICPV